jgi:hypothetical protein
VGVQVPPPAPPITSQYTASAEGESDSGPWGTPWGLTAMVFAHGQHREARPVLAHGVAPSSTTACRSGCSGRTPAVWSGQLASVPPRRAWSWSESRAGSWYRCGTWRRHPSPPQAAVTGRRRRSGAARGRARRTAPPARPECVCRSGAAGPVSICCLPVPVGVLSVLAGQASSTDSEGSRLLWLLAGAASAAAVVVGGGLIWALASPGRAEARAERPRHRQGLSTVQVPETAPHINGKTPYGALRGVDGVRAPQANAFRLGSLSGASESKR